MKENPPTNKADAIRIFDAKDIGRSLREVAVEVIQRESENVEAHWYHSAKDADMFIWKDSKKNIIKQQITFYGQLIEWNVLEGVRTGMIIEDEESKKVTPSAMIKYDSSPQPQGIEQGLDIISHVTGLSDLDRLQLIENFIKAPRLSHMSPEDIWAKFGRGSAPLKRTLGLAWWQRFMKFLGFGKK